MKWKCLDSFHTVRSAKHCRLIAFALGGIVVFFVSMKKRNILMCIYANQYNFFLLTTILKKFFDVMLFKNKKCSKKFFNSFHSRLVLTDWRAGNSNKNFRAFNKEMKLFQKLCVKKNTIYELKKTT